MAHSCMQCAVAGPPLGAPCVAVTFLALSLAPNKYTCTPADFDRWSDAGSLLLVVFELPLQASYSLFHLAVGSTPGNLKLPHNTMALLPGQGCYCLIAADTCLTQICWLLQFWCSLRDMYCCRTGLAGQLYLLVVCVHDLCVGCPPAWCLVHVWCFAWQPPCAVHTASTVQALAGLFAGVVFVLGPVLHWPFVQFQLLAIVEACHKRCCARD